MHRCRLLVEGQTEETFANRTLLPHLYSLGFHDVSVTLVTTKRSASGSKFRGGVTSWGQLRKDIDLLRIDRGALVTTMLDYYGLPLDVPGMADRPFASDARGRVRHVEDAVRDAVDATNFVPHLMLHEFEALLYADPQAVADHFADVAIGASMRADIAQCGEAELVNEGPNTAPSKRLISYRPGYVKTADGPNILDDIGLPAVRAACPHFDEWLSTIESHAP
jgi:hypothetical protein